MMRNKASILISFIVLLLLFGCGGGTGDSTAAGPESAPESAPSSAPVTLKFYTMLASLTEADWQNLIAKPLELKYPNITLEMIPTGKGSQITDLVADHNVPDILFAGRTHVIQVDELKLFHDMAGDVKQNNFDLNKYKSGVIDAIRKYDPTETRLIGLPLYMNTSLTFYNKDVFDKFGVSYPKDGLIWEDLVEVAKRLTRLDNGEQYYGIWPSTWSVMSDQLQQARVKGAVSLIDTDNMRAVFGLQKSLYGVQAGLKVTNNGNVAMDTFTKDRKLGILPYYINNVFPVMEQLQKDGKPFNWDMVNFPSFRAQPGVLPPNGIYMLAMTEQGQHKKEAFQAIKFLSSDVEVQTAISKTGKLSAIRNPKVADVYGETYTSLKGKNRDVLLENKAAPAIIPEKFDSIANKYLNQAIVNVVEKQVDINTALREANLKTENDIKAQLAQ
jgi:multiple sugar transport system substrate-binding protein